MIKVYFETKGYAKLLAIFDNEETYDACYYALDLLRQQEGYDIMTESVINDIDLNNVDI